jgi:arabinofuranosyltransferase
VDRVTGLSAAETPSGLPKALAVLITLVFVAVLIRTAWISDDAAITLRTVLNVTHGFGLTFNIQERVATFTHPLWLGFLSLAYLFAGNAYAGTLALSIVTSVAAFWLAVTRAASPVQGIAAAAALLFSRAFVDFATSGLENPLSYVLLAVFVALLLSERVSPARWLTGLWTLASLLYLTRPDDVLFVLPMLALASWRVRAVRTVLKAVLIGLLPAVLWTVFAIVYYGFPFPNTAYAKIATGIDGGELRAQGLLYLVDSLERDPLTLTVVAFAVALSLLQRRSEARALATGLVLYLLYVVSIGGDFMAGRFLAVPLFGAVLLLGRLAGGTRTLWIPAAVAFVVVGSMSRPAPLWSNSTFGNQPPGPNGIIDERAFYFSDKSLVRARRATFRSPDWPTADREPSRLNVMNTCGLMGTSGLELGPFTYLLDECALADPLLARLPAIFNPEWRPGHYTRMVPAGYRESLESSGNAIGDHGLREYYDRLRLITRSSDLLSWDRLRTIFAMNTGAYDSLINRFYYRYNGSVASLDELNTIRDAGTPSNAEGNRTLTRPLAISCPDRSRRRYLDVTLDSDDSYQMRFLNGGATVGILDLGPVPEYRRKPGLTAYTLDVPAEASRRGFDTILLTPVKGDGHYALGHLLLEGSPATDPLLYKRVAIRDGLVAQ